MRVLESGKEVGSATFTREKTATGGLRNTVVIEVAMGDETQKAVQERVYDGKGAPISEKWTITRSQTGSGKQKQPVTTTILGTYDAKGIALKISAAGQTRSQRAEAKGVPTRTNPAVLWFWSIKPAPGTKVTYGRFELEGMAFKSDTIHYVGPKSVTIAGKTYQGHEVRFTDSTYLLDAQGLPLRMTQGTVLFERR